VGESGSYPDRDRGEKTREQLIDELEKLEARNAALEGSCKAVCDEKIFMNGDCSRILLHSTDAAIALYQEERFIYANPAMERLTGYSKEEMCRMNFVHWLRPESKELVRKITSERLNGLPVPERYEIVFVRKNGEERWVQITAGKFTYEGKPTGLITPST
jgi:PAS domain S-box-containing protein